MSSGQTRQRVMIVDDNPYDTQILLGMLKDDYQVTVSKSGEEALEALKSQDHPQLILMDANMPGINGYDTCKEIKKNTETDDIDVVFISANNSPQEILNGYEAGAVDYVVKPFTVEVVHRKIRKALEVQGKKSDLSQKASVANEVAMMAMSDTSDLGNVVNFLRESFKLDSEEQLADLLVSAISAFNFSAVVYFECGDSQHSRSSDGDPSMLELDLLERLIGSQTPFIERGEKLVAVKRNISVLLKNADKSAARMGSAKDYLMVLLEGANAKIDYLIEKKRQAAKREENANQVILEAEQALSEIQEIQKVHKAESVQIMDTMVAEVEDAFVSLGLSEAQEERLLGILSEASATALNHFEEGLKMDERVTEIIRSLSSVARKKD